MTCLKSWSGSTPVHVYPVDDLRAHDTSGRDCWCRPRVEDEGGHQIVVHNSMDGRERYETGERKPH